MQWAYFEKRSAMALFLPRVETIDSSLAVTLSDWDAHCLRLNWAREAIFVARLSDQFVSLARNTRRNSERWHKKNELVEPNENKNNVSSGGKLLSSAALNLESLCRTEETPFLYISIFFTYTLLHC